MILIRQKRLNIVILMDYRMMNWKIYNAKEEIQGNPEKLIMVQDSVQV